MARKVITAEEEMAAIREAEAARDAGAELVPVRSRRGPNLSAVLSVRLNAAELVAIRAIAEKRRMSIATLIQEAVSQFAATGPRENFSSLTGMVVINQQDPLLSWAGGNSVECDFGRERVTA